LFARVSLIGSLTHGSAEKWCGDASVFKPGFGGVRSPSQARFQAPEARTGYEQS